MGNNGYNTIKKKKKNPKTKLHPSYVPSYFLKKGLGHAFSCVPEESACLRGVGHGSQNEVPMLPS